MIQNLKLFVVLTLLLSGILIRTSFSQNPPAPPDPEKMVQQMKKDLSLSEDQTNKMKLALQERHKAMEAAKNQSEETRKSSAEKADKVFMEKAKTFLSNEQFEKLKSKEEEHRKNRKKNGPPVKN